MAEITTQHLSSPSLSSFLTSSVASGYPFIQSQATLMDCVSLGYLKRWESQYTQSFKTSRKDFLVCNETGFLASLAMWHILYRFFELEPNCCVILANCSMNNLALTELFMGPRCRSMGICPAKSTSIVSGHSWGVRCAKT